MPPRRAAKRDTNEAPIVRGLREIGATVQQLNEKDAPDLVVGFRGDNYLFEVKDPANYGKLRPGQKDWHENWRGQVHVIECVEDAWQVMGVTW